MRERFLTFTYGRIDGSNNCGTFVGFLAASAEITVDEAKAFFAPEVEAGRLVYGHSDLTDEEFVCRPETT